jgi:hypothetical protein
MQQVNGLIVLRLSRSGLATFTSQRATAGR